ncbi:MAG: B12-binding domain-containing radical SAM protein, partial [Planctomycetota bacterium]
APWPRRDLIQRHRYLVPNSIVVSRGCPHQCEFCYTDSFYRGGRRFYTMAADQALAQIDALPGRHVFFLDDNIFGDRRFAGALFDRMRGMGRLWQGAATVQAVLTSKLLTPAVESGLRSLFIGFESLSAASLRRLNKHHNHREDYDRAVRQLRDRGVMINASFVFGMDDDDEDVFDRTVDWAVEQGIETCTFHILTPYPGTRLYERMRSEGRLLTTNWDLYDTRHAVFSPARMSPETLEAGYWRAYERFYRWRNIVKASGVKQGLGRRLRHLAYTGGWKKLEAFWNVIIKCGCIGRMAPLLEAVLGGSPRRDEADDALVSAAVPDLTARARSKGNRSDDPQAGQSHRAA